MWSSGLLLNVTYYIAIEHNGFINFVGQMTGCPRLNLGFLDDLFELA